ncbi:MAG: response regulator transcription factor [Erysipelotrichaceae bacterium]
MAKILICDDEPGLRTVLKRYCVFEGFEVEEANNGVEAVQKCKSDHFDLILMDVMMPEMDGFCAVKTIRQYCHTPVMMLSARGEEHDKVLGFGLGVDDYVLKPFSCKEVMLRVHAILRRSKPTKVEETSMRSVFQISGLHVDMSAYKVSVDGVVMDMALKEYDLLFYLIRNKNIALARSTIMETVWGFDYCGDDRTLDTHMKLLRKSLGPYASHITTLRGLGYRFDG